MAKLIRRALRCAMLWAAVSGAMGSAQTPPPSEVVAAPADFAIEVDPSETPLPRFRRGWFQGWQNTAGWLGDGGDDGLGITTFETQLRTGIPLGSFDNILAIAPSFRVDSLDAPVGIDLPSNLYETGVNLFWTRPISDRWRVLASVTPSVRSDFTTSQDALRVFGLGLLVWDWVPDQLELSFGAVALGRDDIPVLPAVGLRWTPTPRWRYDLMFPRPRVAYRLDKQGSDSETWVYLAGSLGGNTYAVTRQDGTHDLLSLRDLRGLIGCEYLLPGGRGVFVEAGWVTGRKIEYERQPMTLEFDDCAMIRCGLNF